MYPQIIQPNLAAISSCLSFRRATVDMFTNRLTRRPRASDSVSEHLNDLIMPYRNVLRDYWASMMKTTQTGSYQTAPSGQDDWGNVIVATVCPAPRYHTRTVTMASHSHPGSDVTSVATQLKGI